MNTVMDLAAGKELFKSPRPTPKFLSQRAVFSHKKDVGRTRDAPPPRPPLKSVPPISRLFPSKTKDECLRAHSVSFMDAINSTAELQSPHYDASSNGLFFDQCFEIQCKLGEGSFGEVFKVKSKEDGKMYAVKRSRERFRGEADKRRKLTEVQKMEVLSRHPNCVEFHQAWAEKGHLYIQTEICQTSLENFTDTNHDITEDKSWQILIDLLQGVKNLHDHNLLHMDIKPDNIFLSYDGVCKLGDFGLALECDGDMSEAQEGDPKYLAPELLQGKFGKEADIFSLGITMLELVCDLDLPRNGELWHELRSGNIPDEITEGVSSDLKEIIEEMMKPDPRRRPNVYELIQKPAVQTAWSRRRRMLLISNYISKVQLLFSLLYSLLIYIWVLTLGKLIQKNTLESETPAKQELKQYTKDWDLSFSDDECFDNNSSLGSLLNDSSFSSEEAQSRISLHNISSSNFSSLYSRTPIKARTPRATSVTPIPRNSSPKCNLFGPSGRFTPTESPRTDKHASPSPNGRIFVEESGTRTKVEPINLMDIFEDAGN